MAMIGSVSPLGLKQLIQGSAEIALIDVREEGLFVEAHILHARNVPLKDLSSRICSLVPRCNVPIVLVDSGDQQSRIAVDASETLVALGYKQISILDGGIAKWRSDNYEIFSGTHVPSKAFGELVELTHDTPHLSPREIKALIDDRAEMIILDTRSFEEYQKMCIPNAISLPGGELVYRIHDLVTNPETLIVVNCAGRTRSIIGAQSLINAGISNRVVALRDGTAGWQLAGLPLQYGQARIAPPATENGLRQARLAVAALAERYAVKHISREELLRWQADDNRTLYLLDVRTPAEYRAGHLSGSRSAPGGQLIQATDQFVGVLCARIVLIDDDGVRAVMTASWLTQMGWPDVAVLQIAPEDKLIGAPSLTRSSAVTNDLVAGIEPGPLRGLLNSSLAVMVVDFAPLETYWKGHLPGAFHVVTGELKGLANYLANLDMIVVTAQDDVSARLAAHELLTMVDQSGLRLLTGGTAAWSEARLPLEEGDGRLLRVHGGLEDPSIASGVALNLELQKYLSWEVGLVEQIRRDGDTKFFKNAPS